MNATRLVIWSVAAAAAIGVTTTAVTVANATGGGRDDVLSQDDVSRELADEATPSPVTPSPPAANIDGQATTLQSRAGQLVVRCDGAMIRLETWSPNPGYRADDVVRGPTAAVLWFESDQQDDVEVVVTCLPTGEPSMVQNAEPDDHGGDRDDDDRDDDDNSGRG